MEKRYKPQEIEKKWQAKWESDNLYQTPQPSANREKQYVLDMFPYPSGAGLHVGHMEGYVATDVISRYLRMKGFAVLHPMGWDAFGLPAENYAIKEGVAPEESTHKNIANFRKQLKLLGLSYDWSREIDTSASNYYKWTQWLFILLFKKGLAYKKRAPANWCPKDETVLANEQVVDGKCERCGTEVTQKDMDQWFFKITAYADQLISGLDKIDWPESTKLQQINWIGRKEGTTLEFTIYNLQFSIKVFTTRPETMFGATFIVLSPEHSLALQIASAKQKQQVKDYIAKSKAKKELERVTEGKKKTGVFTGVYALNPLNGEKLPVWVSDFVLSGYGTGALVGVPGHDERDLAFAKEFDLPVKTVIEGEKVINSEFLNGLEVSRAMAKMGDYLEEKGWGKRVVTYHIRDWLISRQRYWGVPIPMIYCEKCGWNPVPEDQLPVTLPKDVDFRPHGESPIARSESFQEGVKCPQCEGSARREVDTMDTYVDSSWYFLRFTDPQNDREFASRKALDTWLPVDSYVGGGHVVQHLLFARFFYKVLVDEGYIKNDGVAEPFRKLRAPGWILGPDSRKMSKRWGNVITPEEVVNKHGADAMRTYEMFMGPFEIDKPWNVASVAGVERFLGKIYSSFYERKDDNVPSEGLLRTLSRTIEKVDKDINGLRFNTAIAALMILFREMGKDSPGRAEWKKFLLILAPFAPHLSEELWAEFKEDSIHKQSWPELHKAQISEEVIIPVSVNGKQRSLIKDQKGVEALAKEDPKVAKFLEGKTIKRVVYVPGRILNFVTS